MLVVFIRSIILYVAVLISLRVMGKGEIAEMNCFDLVITLLIAEVASTPMENNDIPIIVFDINTKGNLLKVINGEDIGTTVSNEI